jgi:hypothetical protein
MLRKAQSILYKPEYKATPLLFHEKPEKRSFLSDKLNISYNSEGGKQT